MPIHGFLKIVFSLFLYVVTIVKYRNYIKEVKLFKYISAFCVIILFLNIINTTNPVLSISILKLISFYCTSCFIIVSFTLVNNIKNILSWLFSMGLFLVLSSIFMYVFFHSLGAHSFGFLYRGSLIHPNAVGIILIPFLILFVMNHYKKPMINIPDSLNIVIAAIIFFMTFKSGARGSFAALLITIIIVVVINFFSNRFNNEIKHIIRKSYKIIFILFLITAMTFSDIKSLATSFITKEALHKGNDTNQITDIFLRSRGYWIYTSYLNFLEHPYLGIGFGIPTSLEHDSNLIVRDPIFNIPISAPVEKAFLFSALIEELGILGTSAFLIFFFITTKYIYSKTRSIFSFLLYMSIFSLSIFEYYLFSMGQIGSFNWLWIGYVSHLAQRKKIYI